MLLQIISDSYSFADYLSSFSVIAIIVVLFMSFREFLKDFEENYSTVKVNFSQPVNHSKIANVLISYFPYYRNLNENLKHKFVKRVEVFLDMKTFIPRQCEANEKLNILISATAVQLTFGLDNFTLFSFKKILIYPDAYYSEIRNQYHKGEINTEQRLIVLSANHFLDGIKVEDDGINLGLHEMAHALNFDAFMQRDTSFLKAFNAWKIVAEKEMLNIKQNSNHFLRNYAATNIQEMFAVSTESFFEKPKAFQENLPVLFGVMHEIFQQNPLSNNSNL